MDLLDHPAALRLDDAGDLEAVDGVEDLRQAGLGQVATKLEAPRVRGQDARLQALAGGGTRTQRSNDCCS
jgi:hypothetical protein